MAIASPLPADLQTPCLVVDRDVLEGNLVAMADRARDLGLALRPHAKTHKCVEVARRQVALGAVGLTVATVGEAEVFADAGFTDLFIAYPVWAAGARGRRLSALAERVTLRVGADSAEGVELVARALAGTEAEVVVEVDSGHHRTGVAPARAGQVAAAAHRSGLRVAGVFTFPGHSYEPGGRERAAADESRALQEADAALRQAGLGAGLRSGGSTPTAALVVQGALDEMRPGVYAFNDAQQVELGAADWDTVALTAAATVVSRHGRDTIVDAGSKVLGADRAVWASGGGRLPAHPHARISALSEHHATVSFAEDAPLPELGSLVQVAPNHVCAAVNLADAIIVTAGGAVVDQWQVAARGRNA
ncbi:MAG TPA: alanine racemase [Propionibacteriaceae bacterium]|jgi:D-serine deaminase-like pyridoxal phosphate-dependent protein|nr:alanine racemase [Propionibacteriaceae bacterium]